MPRFLFTPRWILGHVIVLLIVAGCVVAGFWQLDRLDQRRSFNARVERQLALAPQPLDEVITEGSRIDPEAVAYRRVKVEGTFDPSREVVLVGRSLNDQTGNDLLTPLVTGNGWAIFVNRGWVPSQFGQPPVAQAIPPAGTVRLTGVLFSPELNSTEARQGRVSQMFRIDFGQLRQQTPHPTYPDYLWLQTQEPAQPGALPQRVPLPPLNDGPHLSYAIQWFIFATIGVAGYPMLMRREIQRRSRIDPGARS
jgi:surfeit locus 1 family protein